MTCSWIGRTNIVKMSMLFKVVYRFNAVSIKPQWHFLQAEKNNCKIHIESWKTLRAKTILSKKNRAEGIILPNFKIYYKGTVIKTV